MPAPGDASAAGDGPVRPAVPSTARDPLFDDAGRLTCPRCSMRFGSYANYVQHKRVEDRFLASSKSHPPVRVPDGRGEAAATEEAVAAASAESSSSVAGTPEAAPAAVVPEPPPMVPASAGARAAATAARGTPRDASLNSSGTVHLARTFAPVGGASSSSGSVDVPLPPVLPSVPQSLPIPASSSPSIVADRIARHYRAKGDLARTKLHVPPHLSGKPSEFVTKELKDMRLFALSAGGCGLSQKAREEYYETAVAVERAAMKIVAESEVRLHRRKKGKNGKGRKAKPIVRLGPLESAFPSAAAFVRSLKGEQWRCLDELKWRETDIIVRGQVYKFYSRNAMQVATDALTSAVKVCLRGERTYDKAGEIIRNNSLNSDVYLEEQAEVERLHSGKRDNGKNMPPFTLAVQLFSDAALVSWNGTHLVYPIRVRFPNITTGKTGWITIGYIPAMKYRKSATDAEKAKVRLLRDELLQRCLAVVLDELITASAVGVKITIPDFGPVWAVPRIILYACDQPEERHLLGMKLSGSYFPCSVCMEFKSHIGVPSLGACKRDVLATLEDQMEATELSEKGDRPSRIEQLARQSSIAPIVPVLGAVHGLGTGTLSLFRIFGFDRLHVMKLGVLKVIADKVPALLFEICGEGDARRGPKSETLVAANERIAHMGRLILATLAPPGYFVRKGIIQPTYKGRQWRHGLVYWPFMLAGLIGPPDDDDYDDEDAVAPVAAAPRRRRRSSSSNGSGSTFRRPSRQRPPPSSADEGAQSPAPTSDHGTDDTNSDGFEAAAKGGVRNPRRKKNKAEYLRVFKGRPIHQAVLVVVCHLARLMGKICGDNMPPGALKTEEEGEVLQAEAKAFVTDFVRVLCGAVNTTKMHRLAFHLLQELLCRGNFEEGDTSTNEMLHKLLKSMYRVTNKHPENFQVQMMRCEQTLLHILTEGTDERLREAERMEASKCAGAKKWSARRKGGGSAPTAASRAAANNSATNNFAEGDDAGYDGGDESADSDPLGGAADVIDKEDGDQTLDASTSESSYETCPTDESVGTHHTTDELSDSDASEHDGCRVGAGGTHVARAGHIGTSSSTASSGSDTSSCSSASSSSAASMKSVASSGTIGSSGSTGYMESVSTAEADAGAPPATSKRGRRRLPPPLTADEVPHAKRVRTAAGLAAPNPVRRKRVRIRGRRVTVAAAAAADSGRLRRLLTLPGLRGAQTLTVGNSTSFHATFEWGAEGFEQRVRAARTLYNGNPWWDHVKFKDSSNPDVRRLGLARLVIRAVDGERRDMVVVQLLQKADARDGCVLTEFGCARHKWVIDPDTGFPDLALVPTADIQRLEHVVPDFEDLCDRLGLYATPGTVPDSQHELPLQRFFVNPFFPWTGGGEDDAM